MERFDKVNSKLNQKNSNRNPHDDHQVSFDEVLCDRETEKALHVWIDGADHWIPKSHVRESSEVWRDGDEGTLVISEWLATQKGLV